MNHENVQRRWAWMQRQRPPEDLPEPLVACCQTFPHAIRLAIDCARVRGMKPCTVADKLGIDRGQWSRIMSGSAFLPNDVWLPFSYLVGNWGIYQWRQLERQGRLGVANRVAELRAELEALGAA